MAHLTKGFVVLLAALLLATFAKPASALLYNSWGTPAITDDTKDSLATPGVIGGTDISKLYYAKDGTSHYFRMDMAGPISGSDYANLYGIVINSTPGNPSSIGAFAIPLGPNPFFIPYGSSGTDFLRTGSTLEWSIPTTELSGAFTFFGLTLSTRAQGFIADNTDSAPVPIPNAAWFLGSGIIGLIVLKRKRAKKA